MQCIVVLLLRQGSSFLESDWMLYGYECNGGHHGLAPNGGNKPSDFCDEETGLPWVSETPSTCRCSGSV